MQPKKGLAALESINGTLFGKAAAIIVAREGLIEFVCGATNGIFGYSPDEMIAAPVENFLTAEAAGKILSAGRPEFLKLAQSDQIELTVLHRNGEKIPVETEIAMINYDGCPSILAIFHDGVRQEKLNERLKDGLEKLKKSFGAMARALNKLVEARDPYTGGHQRRVADLARAIASEMSLKTEIIDGLSLAAMVHDIGKIAIPSEILNKPGFLNRSESGLVKNHARIGYDLLKDIEFPWPVAEIVFQHHERLDGTGYPRGLKAEAIRLEARILAVADVVEAMSSVRPYRQACNLERAMREIEQNKHRLYDPVVVDTCLRLFRKEGYMLKEDR
ncbi:MAG: HD domain-containing protein [Acidobacteriota bacterium]|nr:HD domain-containing protein [Acidobacteriota bacterium]